jgi:hypothetical protein
LWHIAHRRQTAAAMVQYQELLGACPRIIL